MLLKKQRDYREALKAYEDEKDQVEAKLDDDNKEACSHSH
jgi:hypothetical protein